MAHQTLVMTGDDYRASVFSGWDFDGYAEFDGAYYGLKSDGIYQLTGTNYGGATIYSSVLMSGMSFGTDRMKNIQLLRPGFSADLTATPMKAKVTTDGDITTTCGLYREKHFHVPQGLVGHDFDIVIEKFSEMDSLDVRLKSASK